MTRKQTKKVSKKKKESERAWDKIKGKYPNCSGSYPECPPTIENKADPPNECHICPVFIERKK